MDRGRCTRRVVMASALVFGILTAGCSVTTPAAAPSQAGAASNVSSSQERISMGQTLPVSAQVKIGNQLVQLEVAQTSEQQAQGLMYRTELAGDRGMLFPFMPARPVAFWMKNTLINLDMVFLYGGKVVAVSTNVPPCKADPCPVYGPKVLVDQVIELRGGRATELGIKAGDRLIVKPL